MRVWQSVQSILCIPYLVPSNSVGKRPGGLIVWCLFVTSVVLIIPYSVDFDTLFVPHRISFTFRTAVSCNPVDHIAVWIPSGNGECNGSDKLFYYAHG